MTPVRQATTRSRGQRFPLEFLVRVFFELLNEPMKKIKVILTGLLLFCGSLTGSSQQEPVTPSETVSANGRFILRIDPISVHGLEQYASKTWAELYLVENQKRELVWRLAADDLGDQHGYRMTPAKALVSNDGRHCVLSFARGGGTNFCDLLLLGPGGRLQRSIPFGVFMSHQQIQEAEGIVCGFAWLNDFWLDNKHQALYVTTIGGEINDQLRVVDLESGHLGHPSDADIQASLTDDPVAPETLEWIAKNRLTVPLEPVVAIYEDPGSSPQLRLAAALTLLSLGDRRGVDLICAQVDTRDIAPYLGELKVGGAKDYSRLGLADLEFIRARAKEGDFNAAQRLVNLKDRGALDLLLHTGEVNGALWLGKGAALRPLLATLDSGDPSYYLLKLLRETPCEEAVPHLAAGLSRAEDRKEYLKALRYQTGADLGGDAVPWMNWRVPVNDEARASSLIASGDRAGLLYLGRNSMFSSVNLADTGVRTALEKFPRCLLRVEPCGEVEFSGSTLVCRNGRASQLAWDLESGIAQESSFEAPAFDYSPNRHRLFTRYRAWDTESSRPLANIESDNSLGTFSPDEAYYRVSGGRVYTSDGQLVRQVKGENVCWLDGHRLVVAQSGSVKLFDVATGQSRPLATSVTAQWLMTSDGGLLLCGPDEFQWWSRDRALSPVRVPGFKPLAFSREIVVLGGTDSVRLVDPSGRQLAHLPGAAAKACLSPDGSWLALYGEEIRLFHLPSLKPGPILRNRSGSVFDSVVFSPDGRRLAAGCSENQTVWELEPHIPAGLKMEMMSSLVLELWTGMGRGVRPQELSPAQYAERIRDWRAKVGVWSTWDRSSVLPTDSKFQW